MFYFILEKSRKNYWTYADISCAAYPLKYLDYILDDGSVDTKSCLYILLNKVCRYYPAFLLNHSVFCLSLGNSALLLLYIRILIHLLFKNNQ